MSALSKAKELLSEVDSQIGSLDRELRNLRGQRGEIAKLVKRLGAGGGSVKAKAGKRGRRGKRTDWGQVLASMGATFSLGDLAKASGKSKLTVSQAVQKMKKEKKIAATATRAVYKKKS
ncbi:MAG: hypothetical protein AABZ64_09875 [Nitrospinota bacterium]